MPLWFHQDAFTVGHDAALRGDKWAPPGEPGSVWYEAYIDGYERGLNEKAAE